MADRVAFFGIEGLDSLNPSGLSYDLQVMVEGDTGIGKSVLAAQFLYEGLAVGDTCIYIACDEPPAAMRESMANFRLGIAAYERAGRLIFVDSYSRQRSKERYFIAEPTSFDEFFLYEKRIVEMALNRGPTRLVVDSLSTIMTTAESDELIRFNASRLKYLRSCNVLTLDIFVAGALEPRAMAAMRHAYPVIVTMGYVKSDAAVQRFIQLGKMKSGQFEATQHVFTIDPRTGIVMR